MTILKAHFRSNAAFLERYLPELSPGGLFLPTRKALAIGEHVIVSIRLGSRGSTVLVRGSVVWRRPGKHRTKTQAGIGVEFLPSEEPTRDYLLAAARGDTTVLSARRHQRLPLDLPVMWHVAGTRQENPGVLRDIGRGGAFVMTELSIQGETDIVLKMAPPGAEVAMPVSARIAWVAAGSNSLEPGFGVAWKARDAGGGRRIKELVRRMERLGGPESTTASPHSDPLTIVLPPGQPMSSA